MIENIEIKPKVEVKDKETLALVYTPGVAKSCLEIKDKYDRVFELTNRSNSIAVMSHCYLKSLKRAVHLKKTFSIDAYPFEIKLCSKKEIDFVCENILPNFMGVDTVLLEEGSEIEAQCDIPTQSRSCFVSENVSELEAVKLREMFGGVIETEVCVQNGDTPIKPVAIVSDGSAVLGLGNIGAEAGIPVMEGKSVLFKSLGNVDAISLCVKTQDKNEIIKIVQLLENSFSGVNLEDICAPKCFEIERELIETTAIPIFHDDQHGTAIVVTAGLINALRVVKKELEQIKVVISGAGAAGQAIAKLLLRAGVKNIILTNSKGIVWQGNPENNFELEAVAQLTNKELLKGGLDVAIKDADVFVGVSIAGILKPEMVATMAKDAIVFALANPTPEILPDVALSAGARIVATGRSDFNNQINNSLAFPGLFRGILDAKVQKITNEIKLEAAFAIAEMVNGAELDENYIIPDALDIRVAKNISACIIDFVRNSNIEQKELGFEKS